MRALRSLTLLLALAGASTAYAEEKAEKPEKAEKKAEKPEKEEQQEKPLSAADAEQLLAFFGELVDTSVKNAADCQALATEVDGLVTRSINTVNMMWAMKKLKRVVPADVQAKMDKRGAELVGALRKCWTDQRVTAAFKRMKLPKNEQK